MSDDLEIPDGESPSGSGSTPQGDSELLATLLANTPDFVYFKDRERRFVRVSRPFETLLGRGEREILGRRDEDLFPAEVAAETVRDDRRVIEKGIPLVNRLEGSEDPDGRMIWVLTTKIPWRDEEGNILGLFGISKDITERRQAEEALRAETEFTRTALDAQEDTFFVFEPATGRAVRWNRAFRDISGYTDDEIAKLTAPDSYYSPGHLERARSFISDVLAHGSGLIELDLICKDGRKIPTEYKVAVLKDQDGEPSYIISIGRDVSERRRADEALRMHRERLVRFMDSATDSFHLLDSDLRVIEINETALARIREAGGQVRSKEDVKGRYLLDVYPFLRRRGEEARLRKVLRTGEPITYDDSAEHPTRGTVHMTVKLFKVGGDLGLIATDISDRKRAEEKRLSLERQVQHAQKLESLGVLAGGIAHDFNNVLVSILGHADLALEEMSPRALGREHVEEIVMGARRAADLANQMLAYSGKGQFELRTINLSGFVEEMAHLLQVSTSKKAVLKYDFADDLPAIEGDTSQVRQVIMNLITNASEAIGDRSGVISIATGVTHLDRTEPHDNRAAERGPERTYVYLEVADSGCGMDAETQQKLFEPFYTTKFTGRGLGMAAVHGIVHAHGGAIEVQSELGKGTSVKVLFPAVAGQADQADQIESPHDGAADGEPWRGTGTVLLVDDEESVRALGKRVLEVVGFQVLTAADGREALEIFRKHLETVRVVVLDLTMPHMDGEECFRQLRSLKSDVRVILSSGYSEQEITRRFAGKGIRGFIQKPYMVATMRSKIRKALEG